MNQKFRGRNLFRAIFFAPYVLGVAVVGRAVAVPARHQHRPGQPVPRRARAARRHRRGSARCREAWVALVGVTVWWTLGFNAVIYLAGLQDIPGELYEAARVDGANAWQSSGNVTLPGLRPVLIVRDDGDDHRLGQHVRAVVPDDQGCARRRDPHRHLLHRRDRPAATSRWAIAAAMSYILTLFLMLLSVAVFWLFRERKTHEQRHAGGAGARRPRHRPRRAEVRQCPAQDVPALRAAGRPGADLRQPAGLHAGRRRSRPARRRPRRHRRGSQRARPRGLRQHPRRSRTRRCCAGSRTA